MYNRLKLGRMDVYFPSPKVTIVIRLGDPGDTKEDVVREFNKLPIRNWDTYTILSEVGSPDTYYEVTLKPKKGKK